MPLYFGVFTNWQKREASIHSFPDGRSWIHLVKSDLKSDKIIPFKRKELIWTLINNQSSFYLLLRLNTVIIQLEFSDLEEATAIQNHILNCISFNSNAL